MTELDKMADRAEELVRELWKREGHGALEIDRTMLKLEIVKHIAITAALRGGIVNVMLEGL